MHRSLPCKNVPREREGRRCYAVPPCFARLRGPLRRQASAAPVTGRPAVRSLALAHRASESIFPRAAPPAPTCPGSLNAQPPRYSLRPCLLCYYNAPNPTMSTPNPQIFPKSSGGMKPEKPENIKDCDFLMCLLGISFPRRFAPLRFRSMTRCPVPTKAHGFADRSGNFDHRR